MASILTETTGQVAVIRLNRPDKFNAFNREMALSLQQQLDKAAADSNIRSIMITGTGKAFSAGQDLSEVTGEHAIGISTILSEHYNPIVKRIRNIEKPIVAAVNGVAAGAGANIALCCDVVIASAAASFIQAFSKIGLIPDSGGTFFLPRLIGWQKASAIMMLGDKILASEAVQMGMIYKAFEPQHFEEEALKVAAQLASMPTRGLALTKKALNESTHQGLNQQLESEDQFQQQAAKTYDYQEGVNAFLEKRQPQFKGE